MSIWKLPVFYGDFMDPGCIGKSDTNNLPAPTDLTKNPYEKKKRFFKDANQKSASMVEILLQFRVQPRRPIFELQL